MFSSWDGIGQRIVSDCCTPAAGYVHHDIRIAHGNAGQTLICGILFTGAGLGLYGQFDLAQVYSIMFAVWIAQLSFSLWWLSRFRFGPLEWVWRSLTYWRRQPFRKGITPADKGIAV